MVAKLEGLILLGFGLLGIYDGARTMTTVRARNPGAYDAMGPDRYIILIGAALALVAAIYLFQVLRQRAPRKAKAEKGRPLRALVLLVVAMAVYTVFIETIGYLLGTILFFIAAHRIMGVSSWKVNGGLSLALGVAFSLIFIRFAGMSLPAGILGVGY